MRVLLADNHLLVVDKPAGVPTVPDDSGDPSLLDHARSWIRAEKHKPGNVFLGVVHRLDRPVSGVVVFARTSKAASRLSEAWRARAVVKVYWGIVARRPDADEGRVEQLLRKDEARNVVLAGPHPDAKPAVTRWRVLGGVDAVGRLVPEGPGKGQAEDRGPRPVAPATGRAVATCLELRPETGRSHQLRLATLTLAGPLLGDVKYGAPTPLPGARIALHAAAVTFPHPVGGADVTVETPWRDAWWRDA